MMIEPANAFALSPPATGIAHATVVREHGGSGSMPATTADENGPRDSRSVDGLSEADQQQVRELKQRDREVRAHENAHQAAGAGLVQGGASFSLQRGPDGRSYAVGGEVKIDTSPENDPDQTIRKMQQVKRAALAPAEPSSTDRAVAAQAGQVEAQARQEKQKLEQAAAEGEATAETRGLAAGMNPPSLPGRPPYSAIGLGNQVDVTI